MKLRGSLAGHRHEIESALLWIACLAVQTGCGSSSGLTPSDAAAPGDDVALDAGTPDDATSDAETAAPGMGDAGTPDAGTPDARMPDAGTPDAGPPAIASRAVTLTCLGTPCPSGNPVTTQAIVWPAVEGAVNTQQGYLLSAAIYLPGVRANGADISIASGQATVQWGHPDQQPTTVLATLGAGQTFHIDGIPDDSVLSVQSSSPFTYHITLQPPSDPLGSTGGSIRSKQAFWRCNLPGCSFPDWTGAVIDWPSADAYNTNARSGQNSRSVFSTDGTSLFPYMGSWAQGCQVTGAAGLVLIIEWKRGTDTWRETRLYPGQSHTINLVSPEDGAMLETYDGSPGFSVLLKNCTPRPVAQSAQAQSAQVRPAIAR